MTSSAKGDESPYGMTPAKCTVSLFTKFLLSTIRFYFLFSIFYFLFSIFYCFFSFVTFIILHIFTFQLYSSDGGGWQSNALAPRTLIPVRLLSECYKKIHNWIDVRNFDPPVDNIT